MTKKCFKCGEEKDIDMFYKHSRMADGHLGKCKECTKKDSTARRVEKIEYVREYDRNRKNAKERTRKNKERIKHLKEIDEKEYYKKKNEYQKRNREKYIEKYKARNKFNNYIRDHNIKNPNKCESCGIEGHVEAHHYDYSKPLDVTWLCDTCHKEVHKEMRRKMRELAGA